MTAQRESSQVAPPAAFPAVDRAAWEARAASELGEEAPARLAGTTAEGLAKRVLGTAEDSVAWTLAARAPGWRRLAAVEAGELDRAAELLSADLASGADGVALPAAGAPLLAQLPLRRRALRLEPHASPDAVRAAGATGAAAALAGYDPVAALARDGEVPGGIGSALGRLGSLARSADATHPLGVDAGVYHRAGAHAVQELAFLLAALAEVLRGAERGGLAAREVAARTALSFEVGRDVFGEIAKLRAARLVWAKLFVACGVERPGAPWIHATTAWRALATREAWNNLLRATTQVFAAAVGGADSITCRPFDSAIGLPDELGRRLARNAQTILSREAHLGRVADPVAGSYAIERRAEDLARAAWRRFRAIEAAGGMVAALAAGTVRAELDASWSAWRARLADGVEHVLGVSLHPPEAEAPFERPPRPAAPRSGSAAVEPLPERREEDAR